jgi:hypothetical protein
MLAYVYSLMEARETCCVLNLSVFAVTQLFATNPLSRFDPVYAHGF